MCVGGCLCAGVGLYMCGYVCVCVCVRACVRLLNERAGVRLNGPDMLSL